MTTFSPISIDDLFQTTPIGSIDKAIGNNLYGFNHDQIPSAVPSNKEQQGFLFFVRPQLNLQLDNLRNMRKFHALIADKNNVSIHRYIATTLDPRLMTGYKYQKIDIPPLQCPLTNNEQAFIPVLSNNVMTSTGWPDITVPLFTSRKGRYNESVSFADGLVENFEEYTVDVTFRNTESDPILYMFYIWTLYMSYVFSGKATPYPDFITDNRIDYNTRLYRVRLDKTRRKVTKIMSSGPAFPIASSVGQFADFNFNEPFSTANKDISMRFHCIGFEIFDEILVYEFNRTVQLFKPSMEDGQREGSMTLVPRSIYHVLRHRVYPRIDPNTHAMEWWADSNIFDTRTRAFLQSIQSLEDPILGEPGEAEEPEPNEGLS